MAIDAFLVFKTPGQGAVQISGETLDDNMKQKFPAPNTPFDLQDWSFSVSNTLNIGSSTGGAGAGKATFESFKIKKSVDTGTPGLFVPIADTVRSFKAIVDGQYDHLPEAAFYMVGTIDDAVKKAESMKVAA